MWKAQFVGGLLMMVAAAVILLFVEGDFPLPVALGLLVVGIALIAGSRRRASRQA